MTTGVVRAIAVSVFRESVRDKVLYNLVFFAVLLIAVSYLLSQLTAGQDMKVIKDLGLAAMSLFGLFIAVFIGIGLVSKEVEKRSIYSLLAKPIRRQEFVVGKYLGLLLTLFVNLAIMAIAYYAVLGVVAWVDGAWFRPHWEAPAVDPALLKAIAMIFLQLAIVVAIALFFSTFSSPMLAAALTFGLYAHHRKAAIWFGLVAAGLSVSCVYTRYHHAVDVVAGLTVATIAAMIGYRLTRGSR